MAGLRMPYQLKEWAQIYPLLRDALELLKSGSLTDALSTLSLASNQIAADDITANALNGLKKIFTDGKVFSDEETTRFCQKTLPFIINRVLAMEEEMTANALTLRECSTDLAEVNVSQVVLKRSLVSSLVAAMFLCVIPARTDDSEDEYNFSMYSSFFTFLGMEYKSQISKFRMILNYFTRLADDGLPSGVMVFRRLKGHRLSQSLDEWKAYDNLLCDLEVKDEGTIEDNPDVIQIDFANEYIGGGVLDAGRVQEEIRFCISPELQASMLIMPRMEANEAIHILGFETYSKYTGYADSLGFGGDFRDGVKQSSDGSLQTFISAIDAVPYAFQGGSQLQPDSILRDLNKAYVGFQQPQDNTATSDSESAAETSADCNGFECSESYSESLGKPSNALDTVDEEMAAFYDSYADNLSNTLIAEALSSLSKAQPGYFGYNVVHYDPLVHRTSPEQTTVSSGGLQSIPEDIVANCINGFSESSDEFHVTFNSAQRTIRATSPCPSQSHLQDLAISNFATELACRIMVEACTCAQNSLDDPRAPLLASSATCEVPVIVTSEETFVQSMVSPDQLEDIHIEIPSPEQLAYIQSDSYKILVNDYAQNLASQLISGAIHESVQNPCLPRGNNRSSLDPNSSGDIKAARRMSEEVMEQIFHELRDESENSISDAEKLDKDKQKYESIASDLVTKIIENAKTDWFPQQKIVDRSVSPSAQETSAFWQEFRGAHSRLCRRSSVPVNFETRRCYKHLECRRGSDPSLTHKHGSNCTEEYFTREFVPSRRGSSSSSKSTDSRRVSVEKSQYQYFCEEFNLMHPGSSKDTLNSRSHSFSGRGRNNGTVWQRASSDAFLKLPMLPRYALPSFAEDSDCDIASLASYPMSPMSLTSREEMNSQYLALYSEVLAENVLYSAYHELQKLLPTTNQHMKHIASGNWGCGAFGGDPQLKSLLQWVAASRAKCPKLIYYTFKDKRVANGELKEIVTLLKGRRVSDVMKFISDYCASAEPAGKLFDYIKSQI